MTVAPTTAPPQPPFDPDEYRMTVGEHLEELRFRLILALVGFIIVFVVCLIFGQQVVTAFCRPLIRTLQQYDLSPQLYFTQVSDAFVVFIKISLISAAAIASPWMLYQLWQFVAAGLYPHERKVITRYIPLSVALLVAGLLFVYFLVLPWTLQFFLAFGINIPIEYGVAPPVTAPTTQPQPELTIPSFPGDPPQPREHQLWFDTAQGRLKTFIAGQVRVIPFGPQNLTAPLITLPDYISLVVGMLITFALSFQLPLVVLALVRVGIVQVQTLRESRKYVYFVMVIVASAITPGDVITATVALMGPLILLYELGLALAARQRGGTMPPPYAES